MTLPIWALVLAAFCAFAMGVMICAVLANQKIVDMAEKYHETLRQLYDTTVKR